MRELRGKTAVVTGAGSGIGRALAERLGAEGMTVLVAEVEAPRADETVAAITAAGGMAVAIPTDVSDPESVERLAETAFADHGGVHLLCNNAGVFSGGLLWERTLRDFEWVMAVNVYGIVHAIRSFVPRMLAQDAESHIVNTASMGGLVTNAYSGPYYASKFAAVGLTECLAHDLAAVNARIGVSLLVPSLIATSIGTSERNRQERFVERGNPEPSPDSVFITQMLQESTAGGMPPSEVAAQVVDAVQNGRFYIPTKPSYHAQISQRHADMQELRLPRSPTLD
jgi:NAD(P)-dependent dehydrogenase (short-subunit alcohol dehydrogenase family)